MTETLNHVFGIGHNQPPTFRESMQEKYGSVFAALEPLADMADETPERISGPDELSRVSDIVREARRLHGEIEEIRVTEKQPFLDGGKEVDTYFAARKAAVKRVWDAMQKLADDYQAAVKAEADRRAREEERKAREEAKRQADLAAAEAARNRPQAAESHMRKSEEMATRAEEALTATQASAADVTRLRTDTGTTSATTEWLFEITDYAAVDLNAVRAYIPRERVELAIRGFIKVNRDKQPLAGVKIYPKVKARIT